MGAVHTRSSLGMQASRIFQQFALVKLLGLFSRLFESNTFAVRKSGF